MHRVKTNKRYANKCSKVIVNGILIATNLKADSTFTNLHSNIGIIM